MVKQQFTRAEPAWIKIGEISARSIVGCRVRLLARYHDSVEVHVHAGHHHKGAHNEKPGRCLAHAVDPRVFAIATICQPQRDELRLRRNSRSKIAIAARAVPAAEFSPAAATSSTSFLPRRMTT